MRPLYTLAILAHNRLDLTRQCLESIFASEHSRAEIIVVDNASTDGTRDYLQSLWPKIELIRNDENTGTDGWNRALAFSRGTYFVVLNNDVIVRGSWLADMRQPFISDPQMALVGSRQFPCYLNEAGVGGTCAEDGAEDYVEASCLMGLRHLLCKYGIVDKDYRFAYCEDSDLSLRLRNRGYHIAHVNADVTHIGSQTVPVAQKEGIDIEGFHAINHVTLRRKWGSYLKTRSFRKNICIKRAGAYGDVLLLTPVIHALKNENPHLEIGVVTDAKEILRDNPDLSVSSDWLVPMEETVDLDLSYERDPQRHIIEVYADKLGVKCDDWRLRIYPNSEERAWARNLLGSGKWAALHAGPYDLTAWPGRTIRLDLFESLKSAIEASGYKVFVVGATATSIHQLAAIIERCELFVGADSLPMHLAQAALIPTVGIFGSINPKYRLLPFPFIKGVTADPKSVGCLGCHHLYEPPRTTGMCIRNSPICMEKISVEDVMRAVGEVLEAHKMFLETSKIRERILHHLQGKGIDIGCQRDPITPDCVAFDKNPYPEVTHIGDARKLPFADGEFDWAYSSHCLEDLADTEAALTEWLRVLKTNGTIALYVPHPQLYKGCNFDHVYNGFTPEELSEFLVMLGCQIMEAFVDDGPDRYSSCVIAKKL